MNIQHLKQMIAEPASKDWFKKYDKPKSSKGRALIKKKNK